MGPGIIFGGKHLELNLRPKSSDRKHTMPFEHMGPRHFSSGPN